MARPPNPDVHRRLLEAGQELFITRGFNGCGVQEITAEAGIPKGSVYSYFTSKEAFAVAVLEEYWNGVEKKFGGILRDATPKPLDWVLPYSMALSDAKPRSRYA